MPPLSPASSDSRADLDPEPRRSPWAAFVDGLAFSSALAAAVGAGLSLVASRALGAEHAAQWALLSSTGTFIIYNLDRLRDVERDRATAPARTEFIERHRTPLVAGLSLAVLLFAGALLTAPRAIQALCAGIGVVGLLHRRLKERAALKTLYVSLAWVAACVGIPWIAAARPAEGPWLAGTLLAVLAANLIASNLRDDETQLFRARPRTILALGLGLTTIAMAIALLAPGKLVATGWIALLECLALAGFRADERYGLVVIDGALLVGSVLTWLHLDWMGPL